MSVTAELPTCRAAQPPSWGFVGLLGVQHLLLALVYLVYPVLLVQETGQDAARAHNLVGTTLVAMGIFTMLQARAGRWVGTSFLAVQVACPLFLPLSIVAVQHGGFGLLAGLLAAAGCAQMVFSAAVCRLRAALPPEVCGVVILMLGVTMMPLALSRCTGWEVHARVVPPDVAVALAALAVMAAFAAWGTKMLRLFAVGAGIAVGWALAPVAGVAVSAYDAGSLPVFALPLAALPALQLDPALLPAFIVTGIVGSMDVAGGIVMLQETEAPALAEPDLDNVGRGILTDGLGNVFSGLLGGTAVGVGSANIGLASATSGQPGTARRIAVVVGAAMLLMAFFPRVAGIFPAMPMPVIGAAVVYVAVFLIVSGARLTVGCLSDRRRMAVVGLALAAGAAVEFVPQVARAAPEWLEPLAASPLAVAALVAVTLGSFLHIGKQRRQHPR